MKRRTRVLLWSSAALLACLALAVGWWMRHFHRYTPAEVIQDVRAARAVRDAPNPVERFLELRYGPLTEATNRQKAFLDFFDVGHIQGLHLLVTHMSEAERRRDIAAMAEWVAKYRAGLSPQERQSLRATLDAPSGHAMVQAATAQYLQQDAHYRASTAPVISELMATLTAIRNPERPK